MSFTIPCPHHGIDYDLLQCPICRHIELQRQKAEEEKQNQKETTHESE